MHFTNLIAMGIGQASPPGSRVRRDISQLMKVTDPMGPHQSSVSAVVRLVECGEGATGSVIPEEGTGGPARHDVPLPALPQRAMVPGRIPASRSDPAPTAPTTQVRRSRPRFTRSAYTASTPVQWSPSR